jgi:hypothetical protein
LIYRILADGVLILHIGFVLYVVLGALVSLCRPGNSWLHLPALGWGVWIELSGSICPLTPLENLLRRLGGEAGYQGGFIQHYLGPVLYPAGLTRTSQIVLGVLVLIWNAFLYALILVRYRRRGDTLHRRGGD